MNVMTKSTFSGVVVALLGLFCTVVDQKAGADKAIPYPDGYRRWVHVGTTLVGPQSPFFAGSGGIHHIYANAQALQGYETGHFPDGAVIVFDLLETKEADGLVLEGARKRLDVMVKDTQGFAATGGWGFERFSGDTATRLLTDEKRTQCFACHQKSKAQDYVFSKFRK